ncbi:leucine-rich repeat flightless-interacting protein 1 isoform X6 [Phasianus colchicus]|nr:leucine-rich repeat flightless-interacting protein 1 isoform X6 [Phasianus colchicus]
MSSALQTRGGGRYPARPAVLPQRLRAEGLQTAPRGSAPLPAPHGRGAAAHARGGGGDGWAPQGRRRRAAGAAGGSERAVRNAEPGSSPTPSHPSAMGTQGVGRKRLPNRERLTAEDDALNQIAREAEARLAAKRAARAEAREIRMKELERQQKEPSEYSCYLGSGSRASSRASSARASPVIEERPEKDFEKGARTVSSLSAATLASLGGTSSRRGSGDTSISADTEASIREIKDSLAEVEEKYKKAMVSNAQLDNEKTNFMYQVDTLKDALLELEEQLAESRRQYEEKSKEFEREKHAHSILQFQFKEIKEALKQREEMLAKHGIIPDSDIATNGEASDVLDNEGHLDSSKTVQGTTQALKTTGDGMLERLKKLIGERESLLDQVKKLKGQLEEKQKNGKLENAQSEVEVLENGTDMHMIDLQRDANRQISDLKFKLAKSEQEITALEQNVIRLEGQVARYKTAAENAERVEDELKAEKRKLQRELRSALDKTEELEVSNGHLVKRLEKMKANRSALLSQQ